MFAYLIDTEYHVLNSPDFQLLIHAMPPHIAATVTIQSPPEPRDQTAIKLFFTVDSLAEASVIMRNLGGELLEQEWTGPGFRVRNGYDLEGNIFQLREAVG
ncbi:MAG: hypothetical protein MUF49_04950 [Oculatellaceae cyanobacterium Prado106]|jgi:hypothetical protein|nr:hypothetical protein [Oculatellaceae cyanobacterium Prado106]